MNIFRFSLFALLLLPVAAVGQTAAPAVAEPLQTAIDEAVARVKPALVRVHVVSTYYNGGRELKYQSSGSGAIISPEGHVITNHHVAGHATRIVCTMSDRSEVEAELVGTDPLSDIAVIKLFGDADVGYPFVEFGDSDAIEVGDRVLAMGSPLAISQSVTLGIISNTAMVMPRQMGGSFELDGEDVGSLVRWFAHDAVIFPGNSGGPLVNLQGDIIGINEISFGLGGAIPGNLAKQVAEEIIEHGDVRRAWLGLTIQPLLKHGYRERGALITGVIDSSPADAAGVESGDIILKLDGHDVMVYHDEQVPDFNNLEASLPIGEPVEVVVLREGRETTFNVTTTLRERVMPDEYEFTEWGITARNLSFLKSRELKRDSQDGVIVTSVRPGGPAGDAKPSIQEGDILVAVGDEEIRTITDLKRVTERIVDGAEAPVPTLTTYERKSATLLTAVEVGVDELKDPGLEVSKAWLPVNAQVITRDVARLLGDPGLRGFRVTQVYEPPDGSANPLEVGDLIVAIDGEPLRASAPEHYEELPTIIRSYRIGSEVALGVRRDGEEQTLTATLQTSPKLSREMRQYRDVNFEYTVRDVTFFDKADERIEEDVRGVLVEEVTSGGWAALGMLQVGDLILEVDGHPIGDIDDIEARMRQIEEDEPQAVVFKVLRGIYTVYVELEPRWQDGA